MVCVVLLFTTFATAAKEPVTFQYLKPDAIDVLALLPDPPAEKSTEHAAEIELVLRAQTERTADDITRAKSESELNVFNFANVIGDNFNAERCPQAAKLFAQAAAETRYFYKLGKAHWDRPRPRFADSRIHALFDDKDAAYPSGHSTNATMYAELLAAIYPDKRAVLLERSRQIGWDRVLAGVHWPTDIFAGRILGRALAKQLLASSDFRAQLEQAKAEIDHAAAHEPAAAPAH